MDLNPSVYYRAARPRCIQTNPSFSERTDLDIYKMMVNVEHFGPEDLEVTIIDDCVTIHGKHEEDDGTGVLSWKLTQRCKLPVDVDPETVKCTVNQKGVFTIQAPRKQLQPPSSNERIVPITFLRAYGFGDLTHQQIAQLQSTEEQQPAQPIRNEEDQTAQQQDTEE